MKRHGILLVCVWLVLLGLQANGVYNVHDYGAKGDGTSLDHIAINKAIEAATANGGGQVVLSPGTYLCGSIRLKSNVDLHLMTGAKILAAPASMNAYDESESFGGFPEYQDGGHTYFHNSLIWAEGQQNISITGRGMIDGEGLTKRDTETAGNPQGGSIGLGDIAIALKLCCNVTIRDITIYRGGHFAIIATGCDIGTIDNVTIDTNREGYRKSQEPVGNSQMHDQQAMDEALRRSMRLGYTTIPEFMIYSGLRRDSAKAYLDSLC